MPDCFLCNGQGIDGCVDAGCTHAKRVIFGDVTEQNQADDVLTRRVMSFRDHSHSASQMTIFDILGDAD